MNATVSFYPCGRCGEDHSNLACPNKARVWKPGARVFHLKSGRHGTVIPTPAGIRRELRVYDDGLSPVESAAFPGWLAKEAR